VVSLASFFKNYFKFKGRTTRAEFWCYYSFTILTTYSLILMMAYYDYALIAYAIWIFFSFIPAIAIFCRRLHDMNKSGWMQGYFFLAVIINILIGKIAPLFTNICSYVLFFIWMFYLSQKTFSGKTKYDE